MANPVLKVSSWICMFIHCLVNLTVAAEGLLFLRIMQLAGVITSIWNHSVSNNVAKWADRIMIATATAVDAVYILRLPNYFLQWTVAILMLSATVCFFKAKAAQKIAEQPQDNDQTSTKVESKTFANIRDSYHVAVHACTTAANVILAVFAA
jgi:hypothetical protein